MDRAAEQSYLHSGLRLSWAFLHDWNGTDTMSNFRTLALSGLVGLGAVVALAAPASAQATCDWYGRQAIKQQQENLEKKCGLAGPEWSADLKAHMAWCSSVAPDVSKKAAQSRDTALAACKPK